MNKIEKQEHDQKLINSYNKMLDDLDRQIASNTTGPIIMGRLFKHKDRIINKLTKLYQTEKYGVV